MNYTRRTWATVDTNAIKNNIDKIRDFVGNKTRIMSVIKADGYGHGAVAAARVLAEKSDYFAVSNIDEAMQLRSENIEKPILILGYTPPNSMNLLAEHNITQTVFSVTYAMLLNEAAKSSGKRICVHVKIDTGMNRLGFGAKNDKETAASAEEIEKIYKECKNLDFEGIFTHFAVADEPEKDFTELQYDRFLKIIDLCEKSGVFFPIKHCCNSAATLNFPQMHLDMVRPGLILYGILPTNTENIGLEPAMSLKTTVSFLHKVKKGETVSYGRTFTADRDMTVATLPIGYADGLFRVLSDKINVVINGQKAPLIGRICMDQCMADVTGLDVSTEDTVLIFGSHKDEKAPIELIADTAETIPYEIICDIGKRVPRVYI